MTNSERFKSKFIKKGREECWEWLGGRHAAGYGQFWLNGKPNKAHRVSFELYNKGYIIEPGQYTKHTCGNRLCVNPAHIKLIRRTKWTQGQ